MLSLNEIKQTVGKEAVSLIQSDMIVGLGSGSTVFYFITALAEKIKNGFKCIAVPTSEHTRLLAEKNGFNLVALNDISSIDVTIDGADEMDHQLQLIKGGGAALLQEKMVATASKKLVIIADNTKLASQLGRFPLPVEVIPYGWKQVQSRIQKIYKIETKLRTKEEAPLITDHGHYILDCHFNQIDDPAILNSSLHNMPGVVETGLFINMANLAIIGMPDGSFQYLSK